MSAELRRARAVVTLVFFLNGVGLAAWAARIPAVRERLELSEATLGIALAMFAVGSLVSMTLSGSLSARHGSRVTTRCYFVALAVAVPLLGLAPSLPLLIVAALFAGAAIGGLDVAMNAHGVAVESRYDRPILSALHAAFSLGALTGAALSAGVVALEVDVRVHLAVAGALLLVLGLPATRFLLPASADAGQPSGPAFARPPRALLAIGLVALAALLSEGAAIDWSALYVNDALGASAATGALVLAVFQLAMTTGRLVGDRVTVALGPVLVVRGGGLVAAAGLGVTLLVGHPVAAFLGFACLGIGLAVVFPVALRAATQQPGISAGPALAGVSTMGYFGFLVGPPLIGGLASATSLPTALWLVVSLTLLQAALAGAARTGRAPEKTRSEPQPVPA